MVKIEITFPESAELSQQELCAAFKTIADNWAQNNQVTVLDGKRVKKIHVAEKQWRDKVYGNTYYSARVYVTRLDGSYDDAHIISYKHGGGMAEHSGCRLLVERGVLPKEAENKGLSWYCRENGIEYMHSCKEGLKKDMVEWGKP